MKRLSYGLFIIAVFLFGCASEKSMPKQNGAKMISYPYQDSSHTDVADHLANIAKSIQGVNDATAIVFGPYVIVAIDVSPYLDRSRVGTIKYTVSEALAKDEFGKKAVITADPDLKARLTQIGKDIRRGQTRGIAEELASIVARVIPQIPNKVPVKEMKNQSDQPLKNHEKQQLENNRKNQSTD